VEGADRRSILIPVVAGRAYDGAVRYAAAQARLHRCGVHIVTVLPPVNLDPPAMPDLASTHARARGAADEILILVAHQVRSHLTGLGLPVWTELLHGPVIADLAALTTGARLVVLERRQDAPATDVVTMSTTDGIVARARSPVVSVPSGWVPGSAGSPVVVGVEDPADRQVSEHVVRLGLQSARLTGTPVELVHGWWFSDAYDDLVFGAAGVARQSAGREMRLLSALGPLLREFDDVCVKAVVEHARPADLLVRSSATASCLVLGRHHSSYPVGSHPGPVCRAVLRRATCPVLVAPARGGCLREEVVTPAVVNEARDLGRTRTGTRVDGP